MLTTVTCYGSGRFDDKQGSNVQDTQIDIANLPTLTVAKTAEVDVDVVFYPTPTASPPGLPRYGGELRIVWTGPVQRLDPVTGEIWSIASDYHANAISSHVFETLVGWDENHEVQPILLDSWSVSDDGKTNTLKLRDGLTFHDSIPVTAEDVEFSINRWVSGGSAQSTTVRRLALTKWLTTVDELTLTASFRNPFPAFFDLIGQPHKTPYVMPKRVAIRFGRQSVTEFTGTGPYAFEGWKHGEAVSLDRFREYQPREDETSGYAGKQTAWIDRLVWLEINDPQLQVAGLQSRQFDVIDGAPLDMYASFKQDPSLNVLLGYPGNRAVIYLDPSSGAFTSAEARQAVQTGVDVDPLMNAIAGDDLWSKCAAVYWCNTDLAVNDGADYYDQGDIEKAQTILATSDYDGEPVVLINPNNIPWVSGLGDELAITLEEIGFVVEQPYTDFLIFSGKLSGTDYYDIWPSWYGYWNGGSPYSDQTIYAQNRFVAGDAELEDLKLAYAREEDPARRLDIVRQINKLRFERPGVVLLGTFPHMLPVTNDLKGISIFALPYYANAWLER
ncbi:MAG: ABC transporter substrate-binding protein [Chloroflexi bacterium]|nr:ABC transporter substrate-binding protein [Chloroflexota bacterium]